jgi:hypothetical protein
MDGIFAKPTASPSVGRRQAVGLENRNSCCAAMDQNTNTPTERVDPKTLLADLESRQDELLRMLDELEQRTKQALAQLSPAVPPKPTAPPQQDAKAA